MKRSGRISELLEVKNLIINWMKSDTCFIILTKVAFNLNSKFT
jgi:hypothetical protein